MITPSELEETVVLVVVVGWLVQWRLLGEAERVRAVPRGRVRPRTSHRVETGAPKGVQITSDESISDLVNCIQSDRLKRLFIELLQGQTSFSRLSRLLLLIWPIIVIKRVQIVKVIQQAKDALVNEEPKLDRGEMPVLFLSFYGIHAAARDGVDEEDDDQRGKDHQMHIAYRQSGHQGDIEPLF